ncbi:MAG: hypothetical protein ACLQDF_10210 [Desulfomonilia bacterium]
MERKLTRENLDELCDKVDTSRILKAVEALDEVRRILSDWCDDDGNMHTLDIRQFLLDLHNKADEIINSGTEHDTDLGIFDLAWDIEDALLEVIDKLVEIREVITALTDLRPLEEDEEDILED